MLQKIVRCLLQVLQVRRESDRKQISGDKGVALLNLSDFNAEWNKLGLSTARESDKDKGKDIPPKKQ
ncbi:MAG: hypothetical protein Q7K26_05345 [bacterium]|nr:hypothetical protein [bacterium]